MLAEKKDEKGKLRENEGKGGRRGRKRKRKKTKFMESLVVFSTLFILSLFRSARKVDANGAKEENVGCKVFTFIA